MSDAQHPELGLDPVVLAPHDAAWAEAFDAEAARVRAALGDRLVRIEHVGSTSIPGLSAKPIIDLAATIGSLGEAPACVGPLEAIGYEYVPEFERFLPNRRYFRREAGALAYHIHLYADGHPEFTDLVLFRDHLRAHPDEARAYEAFKRDLAARLGRRDYTEAKAPFIREVLARARAERGEG